tara:strand:- start:41 stop:310 length:270 start_codon:yes stop_codon:yes gene_type:complete
MKKLFEYVEELKGCYNNIMKSDTYTKHNSYNTMSLWSGRSGLSDSKAAIYVHQAEQYFIKNNQKPILLHAANLIKKEIEECGISVGEVS